MKNITVITPKKKIDYVKKTAANLLPAQRFKLEFQGLRKGIEGIATFFDRTLIAPEILSLAYQAEQNGAEAVIINCLSEPALSAAKELLSIPVIGIFEACLQHISKNTQPFLLIMPQFHPNYISMLQEALKILEIPISLVLFKEINITEAAEKQQAALAIALEEAVTHYNIHTVILSSSYLAQFHDFCRQHLAMLAPQARVIIPLLAAVNCLEEIATGKIAYNKHLLAPKLEKVKQWLEYTGN